MKCESKLQPIISILLLSSLIVACSPPQPAPTITPTPTFTPVPTITPTPTATPPPPSTVLANYEFPDQIDPTASYLFYLHGKIIEDQGLPAVSPEFGEYQYPEILETLSQHGFVVISEQRSKRADSYKSARQVADQVEALLDAGVPAENITIVGASKGAGIAVYVSHILANEGVNFVLMGICHPDVVADLIAVQVNLAGNVLSIYDSSDDYAGSCRDLFAFSEGKGLSKHAEIVLDIGTGHGILYQPLDEWVLPVVRWARGDSR